MMKTISLTAPSQWASAIVNMDYSGLEAEDVAAVNNWLITEGLSFSDCLTCEDAGFIRNHDAAKYALAADCQMYTFKVQS